MNTFAALTSKPVGEVSWLLVSLIVLLDTRVYLLLTKTLRCSLRAFERAGVLEVHEEQMSAVKSRPVLDQLLAGLKRGDTLVVYKLDRLARSMTQFVRVFEDLRVRGIEFRSLTESIETSSPHGRMFLHMLGAFAEFERELIRERCLAGQRAARAAGKPGAQACAIWMEICIGLHLLGDLVGMSSGSSGDVWRLYFQS